MFDREKNSDADKGVDNSTQLQYISGSLDDHCRGASIKEKDHLAGYLTRSESTLDWWRRRRGWGASFFVFFGRLRLDDDWRWGRGKV